MVEQKEVEQYIIEAARRAARQLIGDDVDGIPICGTTDLVAAGVLDSLGFTTLLMDVEQRFGVEVDLVDMDPAEFSTVGGLGSAVVRSTATHDGT